MAGAPTLDLSSPAQLLTTYVHESGHAIAATGTGDDAIALAVSGHYGGVTFIADRDPSTLSAILTGSAGFLATALGAALVLIALAYFRTGVTAWAGLGVYVALVGLFWVRPRSIATDAYPGEEWLTVWFVIGACIVCAAMVFLAPQMWRLVGLIIVAGLLAFGSLGEFQMLGTGAGSTSDLEQLSRETGVPRAIWSLVWAVTAMALLIGGWIILARTHPWTRAGSDRDRGGDDASSSSEPVL